jgi:DNA polymerase-2
MDTRGFILQPTYRIESGRPVVLLYGKLETGASFLVRDTRFSPYFYIRSSDASRARDRGATVEPEIPTRLALHGGPVVRVRLVLPQDAPPMRERLTAAGIECFEADIRFAYRYLIDHGIRSTATIRGNARPGAGIDAVFDNPALEPAAWTPSLTVLSLDIETDPAAGRLLSVGLAGCGTAEVLLLTSARQSCPPGAVACRTEGELLRTLVRRVRELDPDILTGWNFIDFDLEVLSQIAGRVGATLDLGRGPGPLRLRRSERWRGASQAQVPGRVILDGIALLRGAFVRMERYGLNAVAREVLGKEKTVSGANRVEEIQRMFASDRQAFVDYNLQDARLVLEILDRLHLIELTVERSLLTGMPPDRVTASIASFDFLYLSALHRRAIVAPSVAATDGDESPTSGGHVIEPEPGLYRNVLVLDFKSLYPSIIRTFQIDPLGRIPFPDPGDDPILAPNGAAFRREPGILPGLLDDLFPRREEAKRTGDAVASQAIKILMNSFYGVLGTSACRFASPELANAITGFGREILLWSRSRIERFGHRVLYGDTDSLFVLSGHDDPSRAEQLGAELVDRLNRDLSHHIRDVWRVDSRLEMEFEKLYLRLLMPALRHGTTGARKRYAGLVQGAGEPRVVFTGMEVVRRDWTQLARQVQRELYERLFFDRPVDEYLRGVVEDLRAGRLDESLVYRKALRKRLDEYTASTPPHVAAARKMIARPGRIIDYVMTRAGPEPATERVSSFDHEHYVQKQIRPVAEPVLSLLSLDFDRVIGDDFQLSLF